MLNDREKIEWAASHLNGSERWCDLCGGVIFPRPSKHLSSCPFTKVVSQTVGLANLVDRAQKIFLMAIPSTREPEAIHSDSNDPIDAWMADAYKALQRPTGDARRD